MFAGQDRIVARAVKRRKPFAELPVENGFDSRAAVLKNVIVDDDEARPRKVQRDISGHCANKRTIKEKVTTVTKILTLYRSE